MNLYKIPQLGKAVPRRGNAITRVLGRAFLKVIGWRLEGELPDLPKFVIIAAPHTSNWDFIVGMAGVYAIGLKVQWMGKHTLFKPPFGGIMRRLGGIPIERSESHGVVEIMVDEFKKRKQLLLAITPEGTRKWVDKWKTGFYHIAFRSELPIVTAFMDFRRKSLGFGPIVYPSGDLNRDLQTVFDFYVQIAGKRAELFNPEAIRK